MLLGTSADNSNSFVRSVSAWVQCVEPGVSGEDQDLGGRLLDLQTEYHLPHQEGCGDVPAKYQ